MIVYNRINPTNVLYIKYIDSIGTCVKALYVTFQIEHSKYVYLSDSILIVIGSYIIYMQNNYVVFIFYMGCYNVSIYLF